MTKAIAAAQKTKTRKDYVSSFATAVTRLASNSSDLLSIVPQLLVSEFGATRSELWLWDEPSKSAYLTHSSGLAAEHRRDYVAANDGPVGKVGTSHKHIHNVEFLVIAGPPDRARTIRGIARTIEGTCSP